MTENNETPNIEIREIPKRGRYSWMGKDGWKDEDIAGYLVRIGEQVYWYRLNQDTHKYDIYAGIGAGRDLRSLLSDIDRCGNSPTMEFFHRVRTMTEKGGREMVRTLKIMAQIEQIPKDQIWKEIYNIREG